jgi:hypothetical protein
MTGSNLVAFSTDADRPHRSQSTRLHVRGESLELSMIVDFMAVECARSIRWASGTKPYVLLTSVNVIPAAGGYDLLDGKISVLKSSAKSN